MKKKKKTLPPPGWVKKLAEEARTRHAFVLHMNVRDYAVPGKKVLTYLAELSARSGKKCVILDPGTGWRFPLEEDRQKFMAAAGLIQQQSQNLSPALAALQEEMGQGDLPNSMIDAIPLVHRVITTANDWAVYITNAELVFPANPVTSEERTLLAIARAWGDNFEIADRGNSITLLLDNLSELADSLRAASSRYSVIEVPMPDFDDRLRFIEMVAPRLTGVDWQISPREMAGMTAMLTLTHIEDLLLVAREEGVVRADRIKSMKDEMIRSEFGDMLQVIEPTITFEDIGGMEHAKRFFLRLAGVLRAGDRSRCPKGLLLLGPPGTGKSLVVKALAQEVEGVVLVDFAPYRAKGMYVGQTEKQIRRVIAILKSLGRVIVFIDEIDLMGLSRGPQGDSGASQAIMAELMTFMADEANRGQILWIGASNRPDQVDSAFKRPGRFDRVFAFLVPELDERREIFRIHVNRSGLEGVESIPDEVLDISEGWTSAEIELAVKMALDLTYEGIYGEEALIEACRDFIPGTRDVEAMTRLALAEVRSLRDLPPKYRELARQLRTQPPTDNDGQAEVKPSRLV